MQFSHEFIDIAFALLKKLLKKSIIFVNQESSTAEVVIFLKIKSSAASEKDKDNNRKIIMNIKILFFIDNKNQKKYKKIAI